MDRNKIQQIFFFCLFLIVSFFVAIRDFSIGADVDTYEENFYKIVNSGYDSLTLIEPGFFFLNKVISIIIPEYRFFLFFEFLIFNGLYYYFFFSYNRYIKTKSSINYLLLFTGFTFLSSWYLLFSLNGIRQGLATTFVYLSFLCFARKNFLKSILIILLGFSIHTSAIIIFPFFFLYNFKFSQLFAIFIFGAFSYYFYLNNFIIHSLLKVFSLGDLYTNLVNYGGDDAPNKGPELFFIIYTIGVPVIIYLLAIKILDTKDLFIFKSLLKFYMVFSIPYFLFSYGGYSGRLALFSWFIIPFLYSFLFHQSKFKAKFKRSFSFIVFILGLTSYVLLLFSNFLPGFFQVIWGKV